MHLRPSRSAALAGCCVLLSLSSAFAFAPASLPSSLKVQGPSAFVAGHGKLPVKSMLRQAKKPAAVSMELIGKRYFLWKLAETGFDQAMRVGKMFALMMVNVIEKLFERTLTNARLRALKNDLRGIKAGSPSALASEKKAVKTDKKASELEVIKSVQELNKQEHPPGVMKYEEKMEGTQQTTNAAGAPVMNTESLFGFLMVSIPILGLLVNMMSADKFVDSMSLSAASACFLILMVDLAADTPSTDFSANLKRRLPKSLKRIIT